MKNTRTKIQLLILAVTVILSIVAFMYLPDVAAVQWNSAGATNYLPKIWAVVIPPVSSLIAIIFWNGYSDFYNANPSKSGDNVALTFIKKAVIYFFRGFFMCRNWCEYRYDAIELSKFHV